MKTRLPNSWAQPVNRAGIWTLSAGIVWTLALAGLVVRFSCGGAHRAYAFNDYTLAGLHWMRGEYLYGNWRGFIYSPVTAAFFVPFSCSASCTCLQSLAVCQCRCVAWGSSRPLQYKPVLWFQSKRRRYCLLASPAPWTWKFRCGPGKPFSRWPPDVRYSCSACQTLEHRRSLCCDPNISKNIPSRCRNVDLCYRSSTLRLAPTSCPSASSCCSLFVPALVLRFGPVSCLD